MLHKHDDLSLDPQHSYKNWSIPVIPGQQGERQEAVGCCQLLSASLDEAASHELGRVRETLTQI